MSHSKVKAIGEFIEERTDRLAGDSATIYSVTNDRGFVRSLDMFDKQVFSADTGNYKRVEFQDLAYNPSRINVGSVAMCEDANGGAVSPMYCIVRCKSDLLPRYLLRFLKSEVGLSQIRHRCEGAVRFQLKFRDLSAIPIYLPSIAEQARLVKLLDEADELRKLRVQADQRTNALIPALFHQMFGDPATNPKDWPVVTLGEIGGDGQYGLNAAAMVEGNGVRFVRITDIDEFGNLGRCEPAFVPTNTPDLDHYELVEGDILIARTGATAGKSYIHKKLDERSVFAGYLIRFKINQDRALPIYILSFLQSAAYWTQLNSHKRAVAQPNVNAKQLASLHFPLPPLSAQKEFEAHVNEIRKLVEAQSNRSQRLDDLFQSMLHRAFQGEL